MNMKVTRARNYLGPETRRGEAYRVRERAAKRAGSRKHPIHRTNAEEDNPALCELGNFNKGLPRNSAGLVKHEHYKAFRHACEKLDLDNFEQLPIGVAATKFRKWESPTAGAIYDLEGPDAQAVTMPPAPKLHSDELAFEMAEVYLMALLRDVPFSDYHKNTDVKAAVAALDAMPRGGIKGSRAGKITTSNIFRGDGPGVCDGPLVSQFMLIGTPDITAKQGNNATIKSHKDGYIEFGAQLVDQRVRTALPDCDFMQTKADWLDVQNGNDIPNVQSNHFVSASHKTLPYRRFITSPRDMATYVHFDALYQAYLNACLIMLASGVGLQPGFPHTGATRTKGFAQFGGPHILTLLPEVATRALKAVRYQKFTKHRRGRPEQIAGYISQYFAYAGEASNPFAPMKKLADKLDNVSYKGYSLLDWVYEHNNDQGYFLPMAFPEGSPMHPAYGAGHATVAGACVTILKSFFDTTGKFSDIFESRGKGSNLHLCKPSPKLTIEGELNKLAANISIGRNMGGVHYYTDYSESLKMGEQIAIGIVEEQLFTYPEKVEIAFNSFSGDERIELCN